MPTQTVAVRPSIYSYPLVSWPSVLAGVAVAIALGALLNVLGAAIGASAFNPFGPAGSQARALTIGGGLWLAFANLVALQVGGFVAARASQYPDYNRGMLQGLVVWALATIIALILVGPMMAAGAMNAAINAPDVAAAANATAGGLSQGDVAAAAEAGKHAAAVFAWWAFATLLLGLIGAVAGGRIGAEHPVWVDRPRAL